MQQQPTTKKVLSSREQTLQALRDAQRAAKEKKKEAKIAQAESELEAYRKRRAREEAEAKAEAEALLRVSPEERQAILEAKEAAYEALRAQTKIHRASKTDHRGAPYYRPWYRVRREDPTDPTSAIVREDLTKAIDLYGDHDRVVVFVTDPSGMEPGLYLTLKDLRKRSDVRLPDPPLGCRWGADLLFHESNASITARERRGEPLCTWEERQKLMMGAAAEEEQEEECDGDDGDGGNNNKKRKRRGGGGSKPHLPIEKRKGIFTHRWPMRGAYREGYEKFIRDLNRSSSTCSYRLVYGGGSSDSD